MLAIRLAGSPTRLASVMRGNESLLDGSELFLSRRWRFACLEPDRVVVWEAPADYMASVPTALIDRLVAEGHANDDPSQGLRRALERTQGAGGD